LPSAAVGRILFSTNRNALPETAVQEMRLTLPGIDFHVGTTRVNRGGGMAAPHAHGDFEVNVVLSGEGVYTLHAEERIAFRTGQILILPPDSPHCLKAETDIVMRLLLLHPDLLREAAPAGRLISCPARRLVHPDAYAALQDLSALADREVEAGPAAAGPDNAMRMLGRLAAIHLERALEEGDDGILDAASLRVLTVRNWMDRNSHRAPAVAELAEMASLSASHFSSLFRKLTGSSPKAYLLDRRLGSAAAMLAQTRMPVTEVAMTSGFTHLSHFNRLFRERNGCAPTAFRRRHQEEN
jgi:AraC-like DNA-binding protein/quercetin dioxygenase-like cupin family protein